MKLLRFLFVSICSACVLLSCAGGVNKSTFVTNLRVCVASNPENAAVKEQAIACLADVVSQRPEACLSAVPAGVVWSVDEIACVAKAEAAAPK